MEEIKKNCFTFSIKEKIMKLLPEMQFPQLHFFYDNYHLPLLWKSITFGLIK